MKVTGNSLGGFTELYAADSTSSLVISDYEKPSISGCVVLNVASRFQDPDYPSEDEEDEGND